MQRAWVIPLAGVALAPFVTMLPMIAHRFPKIGLPEYPPALGVDLWGSSLFLLIVLGTVAVIVGLQDRWLGVAVAVIGLTLVWRGAPRVYANNPNVLVGQDPTHGFLFALAALLLCAVRGTPSQWHRRILWLLVGLGGFETAYILQQKYFVYDVFAGPWFGGTLSPVIQSIGTLGTVDGAGAYVAITATLMPLWLLPFATMAVLSGKSFGALLALVVGLGWRFRHVRFAWAIPFVAAVALLYGVEMKNSSDPIGRLKMAATHPTVAFSKDEHGILSRWDSSHYRHRLTIWEFGLKTYWQRSPVIGLGLGGWQQQVPIAQMQQNFNPANAGELWRESHSEPIQWVCEAGVVGALLLALWLWDHRRMWLDARWGAPIAAVAADSLTFFPLHIVPLALLALICVGLATPSVESTAAA